MFLGLACPGGVLEDFLYFAGSEILLCHLIPNFLSCVFIQWYCKYCIHSCLGNCFYMDSLTAFLNKSISLLLCNFLCKLQHFQGILCINCLSWRIFILYTTSLPERPLNGVLISQMAGISLLGFIFVNHLPTHICQLRVLLPELAK